MNLYLEIIAVFLNLVYLFLLIKERISCWYFGIAGSLVSILLFYRINLYAESMLYIYYVIIGIYGYRLWSKRQGNNEPLQVVKSTAKTYLPIIIIGIGLSMVLGYVFTTYTNAVNPYFDSFTTIFSFIASFLEARKHLYAWVFWVFINFFTIFLYLRQDLSFYIFLTVIYLIFSVFGYITWKKNAVFHKKVNWVTM